MSKSTVLFVDDQDEILFLIKRMLKDEPYTMLFASNGKEALEVISKNNVDVVVTDVLMPNMSGLELLDMIKESHPNIVRIILSGFSQIPTLLSAINHGKIFRYITKPWQVDEEAKQVVRDAIAYSELLKGNQQEAKQSIPLSNFCDFLAKRDDVFIVTINDSVAYVHDKLKDKISQNQVIDIKVFDGLGNIEVFNLSESIKVYLMP